MSEPPDVLEFWFGEPARDAAGMRAKVDRWYGGSPETDREIREKFGALVETALGGGLASWQEDPKTRLALILVLDQFTRNVFRGDPRTHAGDPRAQELSLDAYDRGWDERLTTEEGMFLMMPLLHAESLPLQERSVEEMATLAARAPEAMKGALAMGVEQSRKYRDVIARFGRFLHRNEAIGRASTADEVAFLADWKEKQPPGGAKSLPRS